MNSKITQISAVMLIVLGGIILLFFLAKSHSDGFSISFNNATDYTVSGQFGDFFGGVAGTLFALSGTLLIYLNFQEQRKQNEIAGFESSFFEMLRLHRDNVSELKYTKLKESGSIPYENRQVFREISKEFVECYREARHYSNSKNVNDYLLPQYASKLKSVTQTAGIEVDLIELAVIDLAYMIVFFGLGEEGEQLIRHAARKKYNPKYYFRLLYFMKLKPKRRHENRWNLWQKLKDLHEEPFHKTLGNLYAGKSKPDRMPRTDYLACEIAAQGKYEKYYGGHQFRLGHYFRHLYQSYKFIDSSDFLNPQQKRHYGKMLRAQLSTYEQALLFINSLSRQGMKWGIMAESTTPTDRAHNLTCKSDYIARYELIKNLPGTHMSGIVYSRYYPSINFESTEIAEGEEVKKAKV